MDKALIVVGSSGSGKSTLVDGVRGLDGVLVPGRVITRPEQLGDNLRENVFMPLADFEHMVNLGVIDPCWSRDLGGGRVEWYGFWRVPESEKRLVVYSGNNALPVSTEPSAMRLVRLAHIVLVTASPEARARRLAARSPDMAQVERRFCLEDNGSKLMRFRPTVIDTTDMSPEEGVRRFRGIIASLRASSV